MRITFFGRLLGAVACAACAWTAFGEEVWDPRYAVVTTLSDGFDLDDDAVTLREAIAAMTNPDFVNEAGARSIAFNCDASSLTLTNGLTVAAVAPFAIDGRNDGRGVTVSVPEGVLLRLLDTSCAGLVLSNLTFSGGNAGTANGGAIAVRSGASLTAVNCAFVGNSAHCGGAVATEANSAAVFDRCSFFVDEVSDIGDDIGDGAAIDANGVLTMANCTVSSSWAGKGSEVRVGGEAVLLKCTIVRNTGSRGGLFVDSGAKCSVYDSVLAFNDLESDEIIDGTCNGNLFLYGVKTSAQLDCSHGSCVKDANTTFGIEEDDTILAILPEGDVEEPRETSYVVDGVEHRLWRPLFSPAARSGAGWIWHDATWANVAFSASSTGVGKTALRGSADLATDRVLTDGIGAEVTRQGRGALSRDYCAYITCDTANDILRKHDFYLVCGGPLGVGWDPDCKIFEFGGWTTEQYGEGVRWWNGAGEPLIAAVPEAQTIKLYPDLRPTEATFIVNDEDDQESPTGGVVTLRSAVKMMAMFPNWRGADGRRVISFTSNVTHIALSSAIEILPEAKDLIIVGGTNGVSLAGSPDNRIFVAQNLSLRMENLVLTDGTAKKPSEGAEPDTPIGGGALFAGTNCLFSASNCVFASNSAYGDGGAVSLTRQGTFDRCSFHGNKANCEGLVRGGAVRASAGMVFRDCSFTQNECHGDNGKGYGGAVSCSESVTLLRCTLCENKQDDESALDVSRSDLTTTGCLFAGSGSGEVPPVDLFMPSNEVLVATSGVAHYYMRPIPDGSVTNDVPDGSTVDDLLGQPAALPGKGAVRSEYGTFVEFDAGEGHLGVISSTAAICGRVPTISPYATRPGYVLLGWDAQVDGETKRIFNGDGSPTGLALPFVKSMTISAVWLPDPVQFVVTTLEDGDVPTGEVSLRAAIASMAESPLARTADGGRTITFKVSGEIVLKWPIVIPEGTKAFVIDGNYRNGITIGMSSTIGSIDVAGEGLGLRNLSLVAQSSSTFSTGAVNVASGSWLTAENCSFRGLCAGKGGAVYVSGDASSPTSRFTHCSFQGNAVANGAGGAVFAAAPLACDFCSFVNAGDGVDATVPSTFVHCTLATPATGAEHQMISSLVRAGNESLFEVGSRVCTSQTAHVEHAYWRALCCDEVTNGVDAADADLSDITGHKAAIDDSGVAHPGRGAVQGEYAMRFVFDAQGGVAVAETVVQTCGEVTTATVPVTRRDNYEFGGWYDQPEGVGRCWFSADGRPTGEKAPFASPVTLYACWRPRPELLVVNSGSDVSDAEHITLRDAIASLAKYPTGFADRTITFNGVSAVRLDAPLELDRTTAFAIDGGQDGVTIMPSPGFALPDYGSGSLIQLVSCGRLTLRNVTMSNAKDGAIKAFGTPVLAVNCAFTNNVCTSTSGGGAVFMSRSGSTSIPFGTFVDCTFAGNESIDQGGALCASEVNLAIVNCTFVQNEAQRSGGGVKCHTGHAVIVGSTFCNNKASSGGGLQFGDFGGGTLSLYGCAFYGNSASNGADCSVDSGYFENVNNTMSAAPTIKSDAVETKKQYLIVGAPDIFVADALHPVVNGVTHTVFMPNVEKTWLDGGFWIWHSEDWSELAVSTGLVRTSEDTTVLFGTYDGAFILKQVDQRGVSIFDPYRGAVVPEQQIGDQGLLVTTLEDSVDPTDGRLSLREAFNSANPSVIDPDEDGWYRIRFADSLFTNGAVNVSLTMPQSINVSAKVRVIGSTPSRRVKLTVNQQTADSINVAKTGALMLEDLTVGWRQNTKTSRLVASSGSLTLARCTFAECTQAYGATAAMVDCLDGTATIEGCSFVGEGRYQGSVNCVKAVLSVVDCTFSRLALGACEVSPVQITGMGSLFVVNCTLAENVSNHAAIFGTSKLSRVFVLNSIVAFNRQPNGNVQYDIDFSGVSGGSLLELKVVLSVYHALGDTGYVFNNCIGCTKAASAAIDDLFAGGPRTIRVNGTDRVFLLPKMNGVGDRTGGYVWRNDDWSQVTVTSNYVSRAGRIGVSGPSTNDAQAVVLVGRYDIAGRDALRGIDVRYIATDRRATPGSYTTPEDAEMNEVGELVVNVCDDESSSTAYDGHLSLREAVDYAQAHPEWRTNDACTIRFDDDVFKDKHNRTIVSKMRQIDVTAFTNGMLNVIGPSESDNSLTLDGGGSYRLFHIAAGNRVAFANLTFTNAVSQRAGACQTYSGGAIHNAGELVMSNCAFRVCRTKDVNTGYASGGAIHTAAGGRTLVERSTFVGCVAAEGGAVSADAGATNVFATSVFSGNAAEIGATFCSGSGGAVAVLGDRARTVLVNCTVTGNESEMSGGAVYVAGNSLTETRLYLLDSLVLGNRTRKTGGAADMQLTAGKAQVRHSWYGQTNDGIDERIDRDATVRTSRVPADIFALLDEHGSAMPRNMQVNGVYHAFYSLNDAVDAGAAFVRTYDGWRNVGYAETSAGKPKVLYSQSSAAAIKLQQSGYLRAQDQFGADVGERALMGATAAYVSTNTPPPVVEIDPLCVTNNDALTFAQVLRYAATHVDDASLVSNGCLNVSFSENFTIQLDGALTLADFANVKLRIVGPVTLDARGNSRIFTLLNGSGLVLENVTLTGGAAMDATYHDSDMFGGAIYAEGASHLWASDCVFDSCAATDGLGGAVMLYESWGHFERCKFTGCTAGDDGGSCVCRWDSEATFIDCSLNDSHDMALKQEVVDNLHALVIRADPANRKDYYSTVAEALIRCVKGDTLMLLDPGSVDWDEVATRLPQGVILQVVPSDGDGDMLMSVAAAKNAALESTTPWFAASVKTIGGVPSLIVGLDPDVAAPKVSNEGFVDLTGDAEVVRVMPTNVKPNLWYGLGRSDTPAGPFVVEPDGWVQADAEGSLPQALAAPRIGDGCFYRVIVTE